MIKYKQKDFIAPVIASALASAIPSVAVEGALGVTGNAAQKKASEEQTAIMEQQAEQQAEANRAVQKTLDKIAENASKNPTGAAQAAVQTMQQKQYSFGKSMNEVKGFAKDLGKVIWKGNRRNHIIGGVLSGSALAGGAYLADKMVQRDMKRSGIPLSVLEKQKPSNNNSDQKQFTLVPKTLKTLGKQVKEAAVKNKGSIATMSILGSAPVLAGYASNKKRLKDQINNTVPDEQRNYSIGSAIRSGFNTIKKNINTVKQHPGQSVLGWISNNIAFGGGRKGVHQFGVDLANQGVKSGNRISKKVGDSIQTLPKTALMASIPIGLGVMAGTWDQGEKLTKKALKSIDNKGYMYQESQNQEVQ